MFKRSLLLLVVPVAISCTEEPQRNPGDTNGTDDGGAQESATEAAPSATCSVDQKACVSSTEESCCMLMGHRVRVESDGACKHTLDEEWSYVVCVPPPCAVGATVSCYELDGADESVVYVSNNEVFSPDVPTPTPCQGMTGTELLQMPECPD